MKKKRPVAFSVKFPNADPLALKLLQRILAFDHKDRPSAEEALADPYFKGLAKIEREPSCLSISKFEFDFEQRRLSKDDIRELIYREILEYHPQLLKDYMAGNGGISFVYPSAIGHLKKQFAYLEENTGRGEPAIPPARKHVSLPRSTVNTCTIPPKQPIISAFSNQQFRGEMFTGAIYRTNSTTPQASLQVASAKTGRITGPIIPFDNVKPSKDSHVTRVCIPNHTPHCFHVTHAREMYQMEPKTKSSHDHQHMNQCAPEKPISATTVVIAHKAQAQYASPHPGMSFDMNTNPYYHQPHAEVGSQIPIDTKLLQVQAQAQFVAAGAAVVVAAHREAGALQLGLT